MRSRGPFIFFALVYLFIWNTGYSQNGVIDLKEQSFEDHIFTLRNGWQLHAHQLLSPQQLDTAHWEVTHAPSRWDLQTWKSKPMDIQGVATYRLRILMPEINEDLGFKLYETLSAHRVFIDGKEIYECGKVSDIPSEEVPEYYNRIVRIPNSYSKGDTLEILLHVSNWHFLYGAIKSKPQIGGFSALINEKTKRLSIDGLLLGAIGMIGLSQLILFLFRRKNHYYLYLFLVSVVVVLRLALVDEILLRHIFPSFDFFALVRLRWITTFFSIPFVILFVYSFFPHFIPKWVLYSYLAFALIHSLLSLFFPMTLEIYYAIHIHIIMLAGACYIFYVSIKAAIKRQSGARTLLLGLVIAIPFLINDILYAQFISPIGNIIGWGVMAFFISLFTVTSKRFSIALHNEEKLTSDLSEMNKNLEGKVAQRTKHIEEKNKLISDQYDSLKTLLKDQEALIAIVAHDLKAPLNRAAGLAEVMKLSGDLSKDQLSINKKIIEVTKSGHKLIDQLTALRKFEDADYDPQIEETNLSELLDELAEEYRRLANEKGIELKVTIEKSINGKTNKDALSRIIDNLLSNAIKFSPRESEVSFNAMKRKNQLIVSVHDQGPGFTKEDKEKAFNKFQRLSAKSTGGEGSTGLGLYIVKTLIEKLNGKIDLVSEKEKGSTFQVELPI